MSGEASGRFLSLAARGVGAVSDDLVIAGTRIAGAEDPAKRKKPRIPRIGPGQGQSVVKQEPEDMSDVTTRTPEQTQQFLEGVLVSLIDAEPNPERKATVLIKAGVYREELLKMAPMLRNVDADLQDEVMEEWIGGGDSLIKTAVFNAMAGAEEIPLAKRADPTAGESGLAKLLAELPNDTARGQTLIKIGTYSRDLRTGLAAIGDRPQEERDALIKTWVEAGDGELKKNILDAEMNGEGRRIYGTGVQADQVVTQTAGNASSHVGAQLHGSETNSDTRIARTIPRAPTGSGAGSRVGNAVMPSGKGGESPNPGSGPNDTGDGAVSPTTLIRRAGTTGGLGNSQGAQTTGKRMTQTNDRASLGAGGDKKKKWKKGDQDWDEAKKMELAGELVKAAPEDMVNVLLEMDEDTQVAVLTMAADHAADLITWSGIPAAQALQKRDLDVAIAAWLSENPDTLQLKKWTAEALGTSEDIPIELAKAIMAWQAPAAA